MESLNGQYPSHAPRTVPVAMDVPAGNRARILHNSAGLTGRLTFEPMPLAAGAAHIDYLNLHRRRHRTSTVQRNVTKHPNAR